MAAFQDYLDNDVARVLSEHVTERRNYNSIITELKGLIKMNNFKNNPKKINYIYVLTPKGIAEKSKMTINFMKRKMQEYDELKKELKR